MTVAKNQVELKTGKHWMCEKHVLCSEFFIPAGCPMVDSYMIDNHITELDAFLTVKNVLFLNDLSSSENVLSFDSLKKWGQSEVLNKYRIAEAYIVNTLADLIFLKQHIRLNKLDYPARVFQSLSQAKDWLRKIGNDHHSPI